MHFKALVFVIYTIKTRMWRFNLQESRVWNIYTAIQMF